MLLLILALVGSTIAPFLSVKANPYGFKFPERVPAPESVYITIRIASPSENASYFNGTINVCFNNTIDGPNSISTYVHIVSTYRGDWMQESRWCPFPPGSDPVDQTIDFLQYNFSVTGIPVGKHWLNITANGGGGFRENETDYSFSLQRTISVKFSVSTSPFISLRTNPIITFPSFQNATFTNSSFPLNFTVDHPVSEMAYCLDGQDTVSTSGNTTLTGLSNGQHNVTVYATDELGNVDASDTLFFNVNAQEFPVVPFPTEIVAATSGASVAIIGIGLLIYFKKRKH